MKIVGYLVLVPCLLGAFWLFGLGVQDTYRAVASVTWPVVVGEVEWAEPETTRSSDGTAMFAAKVLVRYVVNGREFRTGNLAFGGGLGSGDRSESEVWLFRYQAGQKARVSYHPDDPALAVLRPGFTAEGLARPLSGVFLILVLSMFLLLLKNTDMSMSTTRSAPMGGGSMAIPVAVFASVFTLAGVAALSYGSVNLWRAWRSGSWPTAQGQILSSATVETFNRKEFTTTASPVIVYAYEAAGEKRYGNRRSFGQIAGSSGDWAYEIQERFPQGAAFPVRYDPENPDICVLVPGVQNETWIFPGIGAACLLFGLAVYFIVVPSLKKDF